MEASQSETVADVLRKALAAADRAVCEAATALRDARLEADKIKRALSAIDGTPIPRTPQVVTKNHPAVLAVLASARPMSSADIFVAVGGKYNAVSAALCRAAATGLINRVGRGLYAAPGTFPPKPDKGGGG